MSCVVQWWDVLFVKGMHFHQKMHVYLILSSDSGFAQNSTKSKTAQNKTKSQKTLKRLSPVASLKRFVKDIVLPRVLCFQ